MLIRFSVKNFGSFRDETVFSMAAGAFKRHPSHIVEANGHQILKGAFLFGANASGKSNFVKAVAFAKKLVLQGFNAVNTDRKYFRLSPNGHNDEGFFRFDIFTNAGLFYSYVVSYSYSKACFLGEALTVSSTGTDSKCVFAYEVDECGKANFESDFSLTENDLTRYEVYRADAEAVKYRKESFLSEIAKKALTQRTSQFFNHFRKVYRWFGALTVIFPNSRYDGVDYHENINYRSQLGELLNSFDTGIENLMMDEADIDILLSDIPSDERERLKAEMIKDLTKGTHEKSVGLRINNKLYTVTFNGKQLLAQKVVANHGLESDPFEREDESDGTQRLFDILPLKDAFQEGRVVVIDELDRSLHTKATSEFIKMFYRLSAGKNSQLIVTTHDHNILDLELLRQDEIWFVERNAEHCSCLYPLTQFKARFDKDIRKDYLLGRYGALPIITDLQYEDIADEEY